MIDINLTARWTVKLLHRKAFELRRKKFLKLRIDFALGEHAALEN